MQYKLQSVMFSRHNNSIDDAMQWLNLYGHQPIKIDITKNFIRTRLLEPKEIEKEGYKFYVNKLIDKKRDILLVLAYKY